MADSNIGSLPQAAQLDDDSLLVAEQQGQAVKVTGAQFKEFGRQAVVGQVQDYVDAAQAAAEQAVEAVSAVTGMTVEAQTLPNGQPASVDKTTKNGRVNLMFGLPRGEQGIPGPEGPEGPRGARGETGRGLTLLGHYSTEAALRAAVTAPTVGDAYGVGAEAPFDTYIFDGPSNDWKNYGPLSGGGGIIPENVVTAEGGASLEIPESFGGSPHIIQFTDEEELPLTADDIVYGESSVGDALQELFTSVGDGKAQIASAITDKGVPTQQDASFAELAEHIGQITTGGDTSDATAGPGDILAGKTAYTVGGKVEGQIPSLEAKAYTPGTTAQVIANGQYLGGNQIIQGDPNLTSGNIKKGVSIFGVDGAVEQNFLATLTVTADTGAVVTATHSSGAEVEALSTTGSVTLELPLEGQWTVTARRGVAQYNSVVIEVSSQYSAALTAEVHIERYGMAATLTNGGFGLSAAAVGDYIVFAGGLKDSNFNQYSNRPYRESYDKYLSKQENVYSFLEVDLAAASIGDYALFAGGANYVLNNGYYRRKSSNAAYFIDKELSSVTPISLSEARDSLSAATVGERALFGGGYITDSNSYSSTVDCYSKELERSTLSPLGIVSGYLAAASNENYAVFAGGYPYSAVVTAYDKDGIRTTPTKLSIGRSNLAAARAGDYIVFAGGQQSDEAASDVVDAYDLFLTRTTAETLSIARHSLAAASLDGNALFAGGADVSGHVVSSFSSGTTGNYYDVIDVYDQYLTRTQPEKLEKARGFFAASSIGGFALFGGGFRQIDSNRSIFSDVDVYQYV